MYRSPSLSSLRLFVQVARIGSFSEAGRRMNITQPALSRTIRALEDNLGVRLFDRGAHRITLSPQGEALLGVAERLTGEFDAAFGELASVFAGHGGRLVVGAVPAMAAGVAAQALAGFTRSHPQVDIVLRDADASLLYQDLRERHIDLAIAPPIEDGETLFEPLFDDPLVAIVPAGSREDTGTPASWSLLARHPYIAIGRRSHVRTMVEQGLAQAGVEVRPRYECSQLATAAQLIERGMGITVLPLSTMALLPPGSVGKRPLVEPRLTRSIGIVQMATRPLSAAGRAFVAHVRAALAPQQVPSAA